MRSSKVELLVAVCKAFTREELVTFLATEKVEPYKDGMWSKCFKKGGPLEWFNFPLLNLNKNILEVYQDSPILNYLPSLENFHTQYPSEEKEENPKGNLIRKSAEWRTSERKEIPEKHKLYFPDGSIVEMGSPAEQAVWWTCSRCGFRGPHVGLRLDGKHGCLGSCGGKARNPNVARSTPPPWKD